MTMSLRVSWDEVRELPASEEESLAADPLTLVPTTGLLVRLGMKVLTFRLSILFFVSFLLVTILENLPSFKVGYVSDDYQFLLMSQTIQSSNVFLVNIGPNSQIFRPLGLLLFALISTQFGHLAIPAFHLIGILLQTVNGFLLFCLCQRMLQNTWIAAAVALAWLVNPASVEPLYWISALIFYLPVGSITLGTALVVLRFANRQEHEANHRLAWLSALGLALALMFHELGAILPVVAGVTWLAVLCRERRLSAARREWWVWVPSGLVLALYGGLRLLLHASGSSLPVPLAERIGLVPYAIWQSLVPSEALIWHVVTLLEHQPTARGASVVAAMLLAILVPGWSISAFRPIGYALTLTIATALMPLVFASTGGRYLYLSSSFGSLALGAIANFLLMRFQRIEDTDLQRTVNRIVAGALSAFWIVLIGYSSLRSHQDGMQWIDDSVLADSLRLEVAHLVATSPRFTGAGEVRVLAVDFPDAFPAAGVKLALTPATPDGRGNASIDVSGGYLFARTALRNPAGFVSVDQIMAALGQEEVLMYCPSSLHVAEVHSLPLPCHG